MWVKTKIETILTRLYFNETSRSRSLLLNVVRIDSIKSFTKSQTDQDKLKDFVKIAIQVEAQKQLRTHPPIA